MPRDVSLVRTPRKRGRSDGNLRVLDGYAPRTRRPVGHAVLYICTAGDRIRRVVGPVVEEFHDALWRDQRRSKRVAISLSPTPFDPYGGNEPA